MTLRDELKSEFDALGIEPTEEVLDKIIDLCLTYDIDSAVNFSEQWMAFSVSNLQGAEPTVAYLMDMERKELASSKNQARNKNKTKNNFKSSYYDGTSSPSAIMKIYGNTGTSTLNGLESNLDDDMENDIIGSYAPKTPKASKLSASAVSSPRFSPACHSPLTSANRTPSEKSGSVIMTYGNSQLIKDETWTSRGEQKVLIKPMPVDSNECLSVKSKYMFDSLIEKSSIEAEKIFNVGKKICEKVFGENPDDFELYDTDVVTQSDVRTIGRIAYDFNDTFDSNAVFLIGSDEMKLRKVQLDLRQVKPYSIFPGQVVMVRGSSSSRNGFLVNELISDRKLVKSTLPALDSPLAFVIASGPYTNIDDLVYDPLADLINYCKKNPPDVIVLMGPFLDADHPKLSDNTIAESFELFFEKIITGIVDGVGPDVKMLFVSSQKDVISSMCYPTLPNSVKKSFPNVHFLPDPSLVEINGLRMGVTSTNILDHLQQEELAIHEGEKMSRMIKHLFNQGTFYPLNPPSLEVPFDSSLAATYAKLEIVPNVMILPNDQKCFIRDVEGCLCVNPGRLVVNNGTGTFGRFVIYPPSEDNSLRNSVVAQVMRV